MSKGKISLKILFALSTFLGVLFLVRATHKPVEAETGGEGNCIEWNEKIDESKELYEYTTPNEEIITKIAIKSGRACFIYTEDSDNGCYDIDGIGTTTIRVERNGDPGPTCQEMSHLEIAWETQEPEPIDCVWSVWSECSVACGGGIQTRYHEVEAQNGGAPCEGPSEQSCNEQPCPTSTPTPTPTPETPYAYADKTCGSATIHFVNPTKWTFVFDYRVDGEPAVSLSPWAPDQFNSSCPLYPGYFGDRWHLVEINGVGSQDVTIPFAEDTGLHTVEYRLAEGAEQDWYFDWQSITNIESDCEASVNGISIHGGNAGCEPQFEVRALVVTDGIGVEGVEVEFEYKTIKKTATTDANGEAKVKYDYEGAYTVTAKASGYGIASLTAEHSDDCPAGESSSTGGEVLGISTETTGSVLGATTMADTGTADNLIGLVFTMGSLLTTLGLKPYKSKKD